MYCKYCGTQVPDGASVCTKCALLAERPANAESKNRMVYILLGLLAGLFGFPGVHNLYAGNFSRGLLQLLCTMLSCWILWIPIYIWTIVEVCTVTTDFDGNLMK